MDRATRSHDDANARATDIASTAARLTGAGELVIAMTLLNRQNPLD